ncbi:molybdopterin-binding protein [Pedobacter nototheniae]|uniref:molybdopterin-binding protein n=1 Tax=Pedobacter nototheniae TaxID=2488994 RepID=UPI0029316975|nr:molybdopterin-binding protein [Pedobacter nototheniae]
MRKYIIKTFVFIALSVFTFSLAHAQQSTQPVVKIAGELTKPFSLSLEQMRLMPRVDVSRKDRDNKDHQYTGVLLSNLLGQAGATMGKDLRGENLTKFVLIEASDGYQVIFSLAELDSEFSEEKIILADTVDGIALPAADGPFRIIVQNDKKPARCIKQVVSIKIGFAK